MVVLLQGLELRELLQRLQVRSHLRLTVLIRSEVFVIAVNGLCVLRERRISCCLRGDPLHRASGSIWC